LTEPPCAAWREQSIFETPQRWKRVAQVAKYNAAKREHLLKSTYPGTIDGTDPTKPTTSGTTHDTPQCWTTVAQDTNYALEKKAVAMSRDLITPAETIPTAIMQSDEVFGNPPCWTTVAHDTNYALQKKAAAMSRDLIAPAETNPTPIMKSDEAFGNPPCWTTVSQDTQYALKKKEALNAERHVSTNTAQTFEIIIYGPPRSLSEPGTTTPHPLIQDPKLTTENSGGRTHYFQLR
jgi:hypothetical protein